ncbi:MAG TPA: PRC-barrel domain-containing protein [Burkholderiales bacterium]|jgi:sporulation protein YlmC with PRC-barrel domain
MRCVALLVAALAVVMPVRAQGLYSDLYEPGAVSLSEIIGMEVVTPQGRRVGRISDLIFDSATGTIEEVAVGAVRYPLSVLLSGNEPRHVVVDPSPRASGGGTSLQALALQRPASTTSYASHLGPPEAVVVDLKEGRLYLPR